MKIMNLVKSEFIKHYSIKKIIICILVLTLSALFITFKTDDLLVNRNKYFDNEFSLEVSINSYEKPLLEIKKKDNKTLEDNLEMIYYENYIKYMRLVEKNVTSSDDWKVSVIVDELIPSIMTNYSIETLNNNPNDNEILEICSQNNTENILKKYLIDVCTLTESKKEELYQKNTKLITDYEKLLTKDKYYLYLQYKVDNNMLSETDDYEFIKILINKKTEKNTNFLGQNYTQYQLLKENANLEIMSLEQYQQSGNKHYPSYNEYFAYNYNLKNKAIESRNILLYSTEHGIKHDIFYTYLDHVQENDMYINTKLKVNRVLHLSVIVMFLVSITSGGIVAEEHSKGTIKNIITAPVKRWKILLSKFIYLILDTYILWMLGLIILSICAGIRFGFHDLITPKLIYTGSKVIEVNYYLYLIKNILIASIPVIAFLSILFFLSTVILNTSLTVGITSVISILGLFAWLMQFISNFKYIVYTPFWYLDCGYIFMNAEFYQMSLKTVSYSLSTGIIISLVVALVLYVISNIVYIKRDIKN